MAVKPQEPASPGKTFLTVLILGLVVALLGTYGIAAWAAQAKGRPFVYSISDFLPGMLGVLIVATIGYFGQRSIVNKSKK